MPSGREAERSSHRIEKDARHCEKSPIRKLRRQKSTFNSRSFAREATLSNPCVPLTTSQCADAPIAEPSLSTFQLPTALETEWDDDSRDSILQKVSMRIDKEYERQQRERSLVRAVSSSDGTERVLRALSFRSLTPQVISSTTGEGVLPPRPVTPSMNFGKSQGFNQNKSSQWESATQLRPSSSSSSMSRVSRTPSAQRHASPADTHRTRSTASATSRRDYVQFLMHLPRLKEALRVAKEGP